MKSMRRKALVFFIGVVSLAGLKVTAHAQTDDQILRAVQDERYKFNLDMLKKEQDFWVTLSAQKLPYDQENQAIKKHNREANKQREMFQHNQRKQIGKLSRNSAKKAPPPPKKPSKK